MSILDFPRINFQGIFRANPCTANNDDVMPAVVRRADDAFGDDLAGKTDDDIRAFLRQRVMMSNGKDWPCRLYIRSGWNLYGDHAAAFDSTVITSVVTGPSASQRVDQASGDPLVGQPLLLLGSVSSDPMRRGAAILCDVDPTGLVTTQLWVGGLQIGSDPSRIVAQFNADTRGFQNWLNFASTLGTTDASPYGRYGGEQNFVGIGCVMQFGIPASAIPDVAFNSPGLQTLLGAAREAAGLVVRFRCFEVQPGLRGEDLSAAFQQGNAIDNPAIGYLIGTIGVWRKGEPETEVPGRKLDPPYPGRPELTWQWDGNSSTVPDAKTPWEGPPALVGNVVAQVQAAGSIISVDLVNAFPKGGYRDPDGPSTPSARGFDAPRQKADLGPFELAVLPSDGSAAVTIAPLDYGLHDYSSYEDFGGVVDVPFDPKLATIIADGTLVVRAAASNTINKPGVVALKEAPIRLITDDRGVYLMPGQQNVPFRLKVSERGGPTSTPTVVHLLEYMNIITTQGGTPCQDGVRPNQTVSARSSILSKPAQITIPAGQGFSEWFTVHVSTTGVGDATILSYQLDPTPFGNSVPAWSTATYSTVRVYDNEDFSHLYAAGPIQWKDVYQEVLRFYYLIYPAMSRMIPLNDAGSILGKGALISQRLNTPDQPGFYTTYNMPLTRTMSPAKVKLMRDFIAQNRKSARPGVTNKESDMSTSRPDVTVGTLLPGTQVVAASRSRGQALLTAVDAFVQAQSQFDRQARVNLRHTVATVTQAMYLDYLSSQVLEWSADETAMLGEQTAGSSSAGIIGQIAQMLTAFSFTLPSTVYLVKTTGQEEGYAAYTRHNNVIVLPANKVAILKTYTGFGNPLHPSPITKLLRELITHEIFHLISKNNAALRVSLYGLVNYKETGNAVQLPNVPWGSSGALMPDLKITNPDAPDLNVYINMSVPSIPSNPASPVVTRSLLPVLLAATPYDGGVFFNYLQWEFMAIEQIGAGWAPVLDGTGKPMMYDSTPLLPQYLKLVGRNVTGQIFHPDEILAQSFVLAAQQPSMELLARISARLGGASVSPS